jgi:hypothetical protein
MSVRLILATVLSTLALCACGGATRGEAKNAEPDPWAGYKGTYATAAGASGAPAKPLKRANAAAPKEVPVEAAAPVPAAAPLPTVASAPAKKSKSAGKSTSSKKSKK